jgi:hypothetical protein
MESPGLSSEILPRWGQAPNKESRTCSNANNFLGRCGKNR